MGNRGFTLNDAHRFSPAAPDEEYVYGACAAGWHSAAGRDAALQDWIEFMRGQGIERVCCLLAGTRLDTNNEPIDRYKTAFGSENVCHAPVADCHLADNKTLRGEVLPFLERSVTRQKKVVVHGLTGVGRTGQVLAAWLVRGRGYTPEEAIETVKQTGRDPTLAIQHGNAARRELLDRLERLAL
jgi:protein-tyrosine phosphatase